MKALLEYREMVNDNTYAIMALMCFHSARSAARTGLKGELIELELQDRSKWDPELIRLGTKYLGKVCRDRIPTRFILEAGIAFTHCAAQTFDKTNWSAILGMYEKLRVINPSPFN